MADRDFVGRYRVTEAVPAGRAMAAYKAVDPSGAPVTLKLLRPVDRERFFALMTELATVRHANLARVLDWGVDGDECYVVSEAIEGTDLATLAAGSPRLEPAVVAELGAHAAAALAALHAHGILHGGVTPLALVRTGDGILKLTDAGVATAIGQTDLSDDDPAENAFFVSPEEVLARELTPSADIYALGASLYAVATGSAPFDGPNAMAVAQRHVDSAPEPPRRLRPGLPASLEHAILRAMAKLPEQRHSSAEALRQDLEHAADSTDLTTPAPDQFDLEEPKRPVWPWVLGLALVAALFGALWLAGTFSGGVTVPYLQGLTLDEARATLADVGLELGDLSSGQGEPGTVEGTVIGQSPESGTDVDEGSAVDLVIAGAGEVVMPDLIGLSQADAEAAVTAAGLIVERVTSVYSNDVPAGSVAEQTPLAGTTVPAGTPVTIVTSAGPQTSPSPGATPSPTPGATAVPSVVGLAQEGAMAALEDAGFVTVVTTVASDTIPAGYVVSQNPKAGVMAEPGTSVTIAVSAGSSP
jgi:serine/threonine-protein kinase